MSIQAIAKQLVSDITAHFSNTPLLINVSGCMGAGKSTWATHISDAFRQAGKRVVHVSEDDFLQPRSYRAALKDQLYTEGEWKGKTYWQNHENWLQLDAMKRVIANLRQSKPSRYHPYQRSTGELSDTIKQVDPAEVVIFESSIFNELFDVVVLIDVDAETLLQKKLKRDNDLRSADEIRSYHAVQLAFWNKYRPTRPHYAIDNNDHENPKLEIRYR